MNQTPEPIDTAPRDGTVILTDCGVAKCVTRNRWGSPVADGWYLCHMGGIIPHCADEGIAISEVFPTSWVPLPEWMNG